MILESKHIVRTRQGSVTSPVPQIDCTTHRKTLISLKRLHKWLVETAIADAEKFNESYLLHQFKQMNPEKLTQADVDTLNEYLDLRA